MRLGGWESLDMVLRYTRSVKFQESLRVMRGLGVGHDTILNQFQARTEDPRIVQDSILF
jgi:hypothetical protein